MTQLPLAGKQVSGWPNCQLVTYLPLSDIFIPGRHAWSMWGTAGAKRLEERFSTMADSCTRFSREIIEMLGPEAQTMRPIEHERQNLEILRSMFAKWTLEVLTVLYQGRRVGFKRIGNEVGISGKSLSRKLLHMESLELVEREIVQSRPVRVEYSLTEKGLRIVKLGEPVMLYLRYKQGLLVRDTVDLEDRKSVV